MASPAIQVQAQGLKSSSPPRRPTSTAALRCSSDKGEGHLQQGIQVLEARRSLNGLNVPGDACNGSHSVSRIRSSTLQAHRACFAWAAVKCPPPSAVQVPTTCTALLLLLVEREASTCHPIITCFLRQLSTMIPATVEPAESCHDGKKVHQHCKGLLIRRITHLLQLCEPATFVMGATFSCTDQGESARSRA